MLRAKDDEFLPGPQQESGTEGATTGQPRGATPAMLQGAASSLGSSALQRKIARRIQRKADGAAAATEGKPEDKAGGKADDQSGDKAGGEHHPVYDGVFRAVSGDKAWLVAAPGTDKKSLKVKSKLNKGELVHLIDLGAGEPANQGVDAKYHWWKVKVEHGSHEGDVGWVRAHLLTSFFKVTSAGKSKTDKVGEGDVTVAIGQSIDAGYDELGDNVFSFTYKGKDARKMRFLQFIWREIIGVDSKGNSTPVSATFENKFHRNYPLTQGGTKDSPGTPTQANWNTDSTNATDPFYESGAAADRTAESTTMMDQPAQATDNVKQSFAKGAKSVVSRAHFSTFLVKDEKEVQSKNTVKVEWQFTSPADADYETKGKSSAGSGAATALEPAALSDAFHGQFPAYPDLK